MKRVKLNNKGLTLIELIITLAIASMVISLIYSIFFMGSKSFTLVKDKGYDQQQIRAASVALSKEIKFAKEISSSQTEGDYKTIEIDGNSYLLVKDKKYGPFKEPMLVVSGKLLILEVSSSDGLNAEKEEIMGVYFENDHDFEEVRLEKLYYSNY